MKKRSIIDAFAVWHFIPFFERFNGLKTNIYKNIASSSSTNTGRNYNGNVFYAPSSILLNT